MQLDWTEYTIIRDEDENGVKGRYFYQLLVLVSVSSSTQITRVCQSISLLINLLGGIIHSSWTVDFAIGSELWFDFHTLLVRHC